MRAWGSPNVPKPVADVSQSVESIAAAIFAKIRRLRSGHVGVFHLDGAFYVFHEESNGFGLWFRTHRRTFVCSLSRMERPSQIAAKIAATYEKYRPAWHDNETVHAESRENGQAEQVYPADESRCRPEERRVAPPAWHSGEAEDPSGHAEQGSEGSGNARQARSAR